MTNRQVAGVVLSGVVLASLLVPAAMFAQNVPKFIGDDGVLSPGTPRNVTNGDGSGVSAAGSAMNLTVGSRQRITPDDRRSTPIVYQRYRRNPNGSLAQPLTRETITIGFTPGTSPRAVIPTAEEWLAFLRDRLPDPNDIDFDGRPDSTQNPRPTQRLSSDPPRQTILVVDQGYRKVQLDAGRPPEVITYKTQTIVTRWTEARPRYTTSSVVGYPCCCNITFSLLTGYDYVEHVDTTYRQVPEADYATAQIAVDRGIIVTEGHPAYSTQIPRLCEFHYGPGAVFTAPVVPLIADINDRPVATTSTSAGSVTASVNTLTTSQNSSYVQDVHHNTLYTNQVQTNTTASETSVTLQPGTRPLIAGTAPAGGNFGGIALNSNELARQLTLPADDRGTQSHVYTASDGATVKDQAYVIDATTSDGSTNPQSDPYQFRLK